METSALQESRQAQKQLEGLTCGWLLEVEQSCRTECLACCICLSSREVSELYFKVVLGSGLLENC